MKKFLSWIFWPKPKLAGLSDIENITLIIINLLPIVGVLFFNWNVFPILLIYCIEAVIVWIFEILLAEKRENKKLKLNASRIFGLTFVIVLLLIFLILPLALIFLASDEKQTLQSMRNIFFWISVAIFMSNQLIFQIRSMKKINSQKIYPRTSNQIGFIFRPELILLIAIIIAKTGTFKIDLIALIAFKTFLDLRSYLRKQTVTVNCYVKC
jgi:hypothetical protein